MAIWGTTSRRFLDDAAPRPGRFIITGSVRGRPDSPTWPGTGRLIQVDIGVLTMREITGGDLHRAPFLLRIASDGVAGLRVPAQPPDLRDYLELALQGGFPDVLRRTGTKLLRSTARPRRLTRGCCVTCL
jgi:hypothetical protein